MPFIKIQEVGIPETKPCLSLKILVLKKKQKNKKPLHFPHQKKNLNLIFVSCNVPYEMKTHNVCHSTEDSGTDIMWHQTSQTHAAASALPHNHSVTEHFYTHFPRPPLSWDFSASWYETKSKSTAWTAMTRSHNCLQHKSPQYWMVDTVILALRQGSCWHQSTQTCSSKQLLQTRKNTNKYFSNYNFLCYTLRQFLQKVILWLCLFKANCVLVLGSRQEEELIKAENGGTS